MEKSVELFVKYWTKMVLRIILVLLLYIHICTELNLWMRLSSLCLKMRSPLSLIFKNVSIVFHWFWFYLLKTIFVQLRYFYWNCCFVGVWFRVSLDCIDTVVTNGTRSLALTFCQEPQFFCPTPIMSGAAAVRADHPGRGHGMCDVPSFSASACSVVPRHV